MARYGVVPDDMILYSPAEPNGRRFLKGEPWPGDAWSAKPGGDDLGKATAAQAVKDLAAAQATVDNLNKVIESAAHDRDQLARERDDAAQALAAQAQALRDAEARLKEVEAAAADLTGERDRARQEAEGLRSKVAALEADLDKAKADIKPLDGDGDGRPGGSKAKA